MARRRMIQASAPLQQLQELDWIMSLAERLRNDVLLLVESTATKMAGYLLSYYARWITAKEKRQCAVG